MIEPVSVPKFLAAWLPGLVIGAAAPEAGMPLGERFLIDLWGLPVPVVTCALGALGVIAARPFTRRAEADLGIWMRLLVTVLLLVTAQLWIIESRPGWLFAFVVSIGMGFAGYSLLEMFGEQVRDFIKRAFEGAAGTIGKGPGEQ